MARGKVMGVIGGLTVFLILLSFNFYLNSDFDTNLIRQVDSGVPAQKLIPQIEKETNEIKLKMEKNIDICIMGKDEWGNGSLVSKTDYAYYELMYDQEMKALFGIDELRKQFARREISKEEFIQRIQSYKKEIEIRSQ